MEEKDYTLIFCRRKTSDGDKELLLGMKKRGFGFGKWNGFGGKLEADETIIAGAARELQEDKIMRVHVFETWEFSGECVESDEMRPLWYLESEIPYDKMFPDDRIWLPYLLEGKSFVARFDFEDEDTILDYTIKEQVV